nr:MAG TPA: hypothetical protein [Bacteriophage sp.]
MKPKESVKILQERIDLTKQDWSDMPELVEYRKALERAVKALEKQIPKEPKYKKQLRDFFGVATVVKGDCPCCGKAEIYSNANYCPDCGQKLDWRGSEKPCQTNLHQK